AHRGSVLRAGRGGEAIAAADSLEVSPAHANPEARARHGFGAVLTMEVGCAASVRCTRPFTHGMNMDYRSLGNSGLKVSALSLGSWTTLGGSVGTADTGPIVHKAFELGINLFDTADAYVKGGAERALGAAIRDLPRGEIVVATKCMGRVGEGPLGRGLSRKHIFDAMDASLKRLGVDYVDLYQFHAPDADTPIEESLHAFEDLVRMGKARYIGFSNFDEQPPLADQVAAIQARERWTRMTSSPPRSSLVDRHVEEGHADYCRKHGLGMIVYSPLAQGVLTNKYAGGARPEGSRATGAFGHFLESQKAL